MPNHFQNKNLKKVNIKNIKMKLLVALFKKKSRKLCLFIKTKSQNFKIKNFSAQSYVVCIRRKMSRKLLREKYVM